jgi:hypothetical protein
MRLCIIIFLCFLLSCFAILAQANKKAERYYNDAVRYRSKKQMEKAFKKMQQSIEYDPTNAEAYGQLGEWYFEAHKFPEAVQVFQKASAVCKNGTLRFAKPLTRCYIYAGLADNALALISNYATIKDSAEWNKMKAQATFVKGAMAHQSFAEWPVNLGMRVNSGYPELFPSMAVDSQHIYFTRRTHLDEDFYMADLDTCGGWLYARNMGTPPNTPDQESSQFISADGHYLFFTRCDNRSPDGWAEGGCDLFMAYRIANDSPWTVAQPFGATINTPNYEGMPTLSPDNRELYFVSNRPGGYGGYDIWVSRFEDGLWQLPVNAGPNINTAGNETAPYMNVDNKTFYFTSDGWQGLGGTDIFVSQKINDTTYTKAENLGYPINTAYDEMSECVTLDGKKLYFSSDRQGPAGNFDLYETKLEGFQKPVPVSYITGVVYDSLSKLRLNYAAIFICNAATGDTIYQFQSNRGDASFLITLHLGNTYAIHTQRMGYTDVHDTIVFNKQYLTDPLRHNVVMLPYDYVAPVNDSLLTMIHFDVNRVELSDSDKNTLRDAILPWLNGKSFVLYVNAYTDNTGTPMINEQLSHQRASQVAKYITTLGVDETMIQPKGWGEAKMIANNTTPEGQRMNRRVEIVLKR